LLVPENQLNVIIGPENSGGPGSAGRPTNATKAAACYQNSPYSRLLATSWKGSLRQPLMHYRAGNLVTALLRAGTADVRRHYRGEIPFRRKPHHKVLMGAY
jgi:hypothetical protein